jgi:hypothetical protein
MTMTRYNLTELVKHPAHFAYYRDGVLYYTVNGFVFGIPVSDTGTATLHDTEKGILLMRWLGPAVRAVNDAVGIAEAAVSIAQHEHATDGDNDGGPAEGNS